MKKFFQILLLLGCLGGLVPRTARGQGDSEIARETAALGSSPALQAFVARGAAQQAPRDFVLGVLRGAKEIQSQGMPIEPYLLKANEGLAKSVPPQKIYPALQGSRQQTATAVALVDRALARGGMREVSPQARELAIRQYQGALLNGITPQRLESLAGESGKGPLTLTELGSEAHALVKKSGPGKILVKIHPEPVLKIPPPLEADHKTPGKGPKKEQEYKNPNEKKIPPGRTYPFRGKRHGQDKADEPGKKGHEKGMGEGRGHGHGYD